MPIAMLIGALFYGWLSQLEFITPYLIFAMLLLTFCKIKPSEMKVSFMHLWLLLIQILGSVAAYYLFYPLGKVVAESVMVCVIAPTATASAVITAKLGGSAASLAAYTLLSNLGTAMAVPIIFPLVEENAELGFLVLSMRIFSKVFPLLICPFLLSVLLRGILPGVHRKLKECSGAAFYIWAASLAIVMAEITQAILSGTTSVGTEIVIALCSLAVCCLLFFMGKKIGRIYGDSISGGQGLGQKNTILAIWIAGTYLNPSSAIGPGAYVVWQNIINSWQLWKKRKKEEKAYINKV